MNFFGQLIEKQLARLIEKFRVKSPALFLILSALILGANGVIEMYGEELNEYWKHAKVVSQLVSTLAAIIISNKNYPLLLKHNIREGD